MNRHNSSAVRKEQLLSICGNCEVFALIVFHQESKVLDIRDEFLYTNIELELLVLVVKLIEQSSIKYLSDVIVSQVLNSLLLHIPKREFRIFIEQSQAVVIND